MTTRTTHTLDVPGATLCYETRSNVSSDKPTLFLIGTPQGAAEFSPLAGRFADRTVVTYDPRGTRRSVRTDGVAESTPTEHADDLDRLISALGDGPVDVFGTGGGAVNGLALVSRRPAGVRTLVAHEPPAARLLPDHAAVLAACTNINRTYRQAGRNAAMAQFLELTGQNGPLPADYPDRPAPDPSEYGLKPDDDGSRDHALFAQNLVSIASYVYDFEALRTTSTRIVPAVGAGSGGHFASRATVALADRLGTVPITLPSDHRGFLDVDDTSRTLADFATKLRDVLDDRTSPGDPAERPHAGARADSSTPSSHPE
ncbi:alpha/beta fold hydrolase [Streptomyces sp. NPDC058457]|uniref:alpha/beta fold hydrolase n=1 Tax=Streptomyces sp. NPDC058457 TaxID=3346507 RepID=UPI003660D5E1